MKLTTILLLSSISGSLALPLIERSPQQAPAPGAGSAASYSLSQMLTGATNFAPAFLAGDSAGVATALQQMTGGAATFAPGFFQDLGKAMGGVTTGTAPTGA